MPTALDQAIAELAVQRGLVSPDGIRRVAAELAELPTARVLVEHRLADRAAVAGLVEHLGRQRFACGRCRRRVHGTELEQLSRLACPDCAGPLVLGDGSLSHSQLASGSRPGPGSGSASASRSVSGSASGAMVGRAIGAYTVLRELGRGSNGVVYLARRAGGGPVVALKVLIDPDEEAIARFELEAQVAARLQDPGVVPVLDSGRAGEHYYYAMEFCPGPTLRERLRQGRLRPREAAELCRDLARSMGRAHEMGIVHRDLKPGNVILSEPDGRPRVTDFGMAQDRSLRRSLTRTHDVMGTPYYMAPEQFEGVKHVDVRADVYALGVMLYEALTGERPYTARTPLALARLVRDGDPRPPRELRPDVDPELEAICLKAMAVQRDDRHRTADDLAGALEAHLDAPRPGRSRGAGAPDRRGLVAAAAIVGAGAVLAGAVVLARDGDGAAASPAPASPTSAPPADPVEAALVEAAAAAAAADVEVWSARIAAAREAARPDPEALDRVDAARAEQRERLAAAVDALLSEPVPYRERVVEAHRALERLVFADDPGRVDRLRLARTRYFERRFRFDEALALTEELVKLPGPLGREATRMRALYLFFTGQRLEGLGLLEALVGQHPDTPEAKVTVAMRTAIEFMMTGGRSFGGSGPTPQDKLRAGIAKADDALAATPDYQVALATRAYLLLMLDRPREAGRDAERSLELAPDDPHSLFVAGVTTRDPRRRADLLLTSVRLTEGNYGQAVGPATDVLQELGRWEELREVLDLVLRAESRRWFDERQVRFVRAITLIQLGEPLAAGEDLRLLDAEAPGWLAGAVLEQVRDPRLRARLDELLGRGPR